MNHQDIIKKIQDAVDACKEQRDLCLSDRRFYSIDGAQWEGSIGDQFENKPRFEINKILSSVIRIFNEYRNSRMGMVFTPADGGEDEVADKLASLYRADESDSNAEEALDNAFEEAVGGGFGAWRLRHDYEDEEYSEDGDPQRIIFEPIFDADSTVFFDPQSRRQDKSDAEWACVLCPMSKDAYKDKYGDYTTGVDRQISASQFDWSGPDLVYVAEFFYVKKESEKIFKYIGVAGDIKEICEDDLKEDPELERTLVVTGYTLDSERTVQKRKIRKLIVSGDDILDDCGCIAGKHLPIIPVYGKRWFVDGIERFMGHVRPAKDVQRIKNMQLSKLAEISALSSVEKPIFSPEQIAGHQPYWQNDNVKNYPYMLINPVTDSAGNQMPTGPLGYTRPPAIPPALAALIQTADTDINEILGQQAGGDQIVSNISGKAVEMIQTRLDGQSFIYVSNMAKAIKRCGEVWLSMAQEIYADEMRKLRGLTEDNDSIQIILNKPTVSKGGRFEYENDIKKAKLKVRVDVGPHSASKRQAAVRAFTGLMQATADPESQQILSALALMNTEAEGASDIRKYYRNKLVNMGAIQPTAEEAQQMALNAQQSVPDANERFLLASAEEAEAKAVKARADSIAAVSKARESEAKTIEILQGIKSASREELIALVEKLIGGKQSEMPVGYPSAQVSAQPA